MSDPRTPETGPRTGCRAPNARPQWRVVYANGRRVEVASHGQGPPVLFLHGWGLSPRTYQRLLNRIAHGGYRVLAPSLPGFGRSQPVPLREQSVEGVASHVAEVIEALALQGPLPVIGHSFGGGVALKLAANRPDLVSSLLLVCPVGGAGQHPVPLHRMVTSVLNDTRHRWILRATHDLLTATARSPLSVVAAALSARISDQIADLEVVNRHRIRTQFLFADRDDVVTPGQIPSSIFEYVACETIAGQHSWLLTAPDLFAGRALVHLRGQGLGL